MNQLMAKCIDKNNPSDMVEHEVRGEIDGRPFVITLYAKDPMDAIKRAQVTPAHLWRLDVPEVKHA